MTKKRGRPTGSAVREKISEILQFMKKGYGYEIHQTYLDLFPKVSQRLIYYHLQKGVQTGEFRLKSVKKEKGKYSWGETAEKKYYENGPNAKPRTNPEVKDYFKKRKTKQLP